VAVIPTFSPAEAVAELDHVVGTLGLKAVVLSGVIPRTVRPDATTAAWVDTLGHAHHAKRNKDAVQQFDPARFELAEAAQLFERYATGSLQNYRDRVDEARPFSDSRVAEHGSDDFAESGISSPDDIVRIFTEQLAFGCEADDPMNALAFDRTRLPHHIRLNAMFASDIGHWDVPDAREVLPEAWELVEDGHLTEEDFADFSCGNVVRHLTYDPRFFEETAVADAVRPLIRTVKGEDHQVGGGYRSAY
jgi:hypothetical protein